MDYFNVAIHAPLHLYHLSVYIGQVVCLLPWPPAREFFGSMVIFICLYPIRIFMAVVIPEKKVARRIYKRRKTVPTSEEHQSAAASSLLHHF